jgi:hypothetical protein
MKPLSLNLTFSILGDTKLLTMTKGFLYDKNRDDAYIEGKNDKGMVK